MTKNASTIIFVIFLLAAIGFIDATYLTWSHYSGSELECSILDGCNEVTTSEYSTLFELPIALFGMIYYAGVIFLMLIYLIEKSNKALKLALVLISGGLAFSIYFVYLQFFVIDAICLYCMVSAIDILLLFIFTLVLYNKLIPKDNQRDII